MTLPKGKWRRILFKQNTRDKYISTFWRNCNDVANCPSSLKETFEKLVTIIDSNLPIFIKVEYRDTSDAKEVENE